VGAIPVIAEIDDTLTIDPADVESKITRRTKAVIPVHMCGFPSNMAALKSIARRRKIAIVEDACQADGGRYRGKRLGTIGDAGAFSFNFYKIISCGEGGGVVTDNRTLYQRAFIQHDSGLSFRAHARELNVPLFIGGNYRISEILSSVLRVQLGRMDGMIGAMRREKQYIVNRFRGHRRLTPLRSNDPKGDCGTTTGFYFESPRTARRFEKLLKAAGLECSLPIDSGRHIYSNWEAVLEHRGAHHRARNPYRMKENRNCRIRYTKRMCPNTLDHLSRTVYVLQHPDHGRKVWERNARLIEKAAEQL
jgi:dTDP-4-amino-4,6-dideoxygalactose transaminase